MYRIVTITTAMAGASAQAVAERREVVRWRWRRVMAAPMADQKAAEDTEALHIYAHHTS
jgi:hypothetical protein